jgi:hypothetical protein
MATQEPDAGAAADEFAGILDDGPSPEDLAAVRAFLDNPVGVTEGGERARMSHEGVLAVRTEFDAVAAGTLPELKKLRRS